MAYALACAALFQSADEALNALCTPNSRANRPRARRRIDLDSDTLFAAYIKARGSHAQVARELGLVLGTVVRRLLAAGLPNMVESRCKSTVTSLAKYLIERRSLQSSAKAGGISQADLEYAVRVMVMGRAQSKLVLQLLGSGQGKVRRKAAPLTPDQVRNVEADISL